MVGITCSEHVIYLALTNCSLPLIEIKAADVKTHKYFYSHRVRVTELQNFRDKANLHYKQEILNQGSTGFLPLRPISSQILEMQSLCKSCL